MQTHRTALVVGSLGVIGRYIVERLLADDDWSVVGAVAPRRPRPARATGTSPSTCSTRRSMAAKLAGI